MRASREFETWIGLGKNSVTVHLVIEFLCGAFLYVFFHKNVCIIERENKSGLLLLKERAINCVFLGKNKKDA